MGLPLAVFPWSYEALDQAKGNLFALLASLVLFAWVVRFVGQEDLTWSKAPLRVPLIALLAITVAATLVSTNPISSLVGASFTYRREPLIAWVFYMTTALATYHFIDTGKHALRLAKLLVAVSVPVSLLGVLQRLGYFLFWSNVAPELQVNSTFGNPIHFGAYLVLIIPISLFLVLNASTRTEKSAWFAVLALNGSALVFTNSRGAWFGALAGMTVMVLGLVMIARKNHWKVRSFLISVSLLVLIIAAALAGQELFSTQTTVIDRLVSALAGEGTAAKRLMIWESSLPLLEKRPLTGWGLETYRDLFPRHQEPELVKLEARAMTSDRPHNQILYVGQSFGFLGVLAFAWLTLLALALGCRNLMRIDSPRGRLMLLGIVGSLAGYVVQEQFSFSLTGVTPLYWMLIGLSFRFSTGRPRPWRSSRPLPPRKRLFRQAAIVAGAAIVLATAGWVSLTTAAEYFYIKGKNFALAGDLNSTVIYYRKAVAANPFEGTYRFGFGEASRELALVTGETAPLDEALDVVSRGTKLQPGAYDLYLALANVHYTRSLLEQTRDYSKAKHYYRKALDRAPNFSDAYLWLGMAYLMEGNADRAISNLTKSKDINPDEVRVWDGLGRALRDKGETERAIEAFAKALRIDPAYEPARQDLTELLADEAAHK